MTLSSKSNFDKVNFIENYMKELYPSDYELTTSEEIGHIVSGRRFDRSEDSLRADTWETLSRVAILVTILQGICSIIDFHDSLPDDAERFIEECDYDVIREDAISRLKNDYGIVPTRDYPEFRRDQMAILTRRIIDQLHFKEASGNEQ